MSFIRKIKRGGKVYLAEVENSWCKGKVIQKHIRYVGKEADGRKILSSSISNVKVMGVKVYGPLLVLDYIASKTGLKTLLGNFENEILSLVYAHCLNFKSINKMETWFQRTDLNHLLNMESLTEQKLLDALDFLETIDSADLQKKVFNHVAKVFKINLSGIIYDVTNTYLYGKKCPLGKLGHDKEKVKGRPLIQIGLAVTQKEGIPLFHKVFEGNIHDARTFTDTIVSCHLYGIKSGLIVFDRGVTSERNLNEIKGLGWDCLCGVPINERIKNIVRRQINLSDIIRLSNRVVFNKNCFYVTLMPYKIGTSTGELALCYNDQRRKNNRESRYDEISNAKIQLAKNKNIKEGLVKYFFKNGKLNEKAVKMAEEFDGYSFIFSTKNFKKDQIAKLYFDKDLIEKAFRSLKGITHLRPIRHWLYNRVAAHVFICYFSYLLLSVLKLYLHDLEISPVDALNELESMYKVYLKDEKKGFEIQKIVALTKRQEDILKAINPKFLEPSV